MSSLRDIFLLARFEINRAIRTWRALALMVLYSITAAGAAWGFANLIGVLENEVANQLGVPQTKTPGAMLSKLAESDIWRNMVQGMVPDHLVDHFLHVPPVALFHFLISLMIIPFFAASASAESISLDLGTRALRYEALRTGRMELVFGRFGGQLFLCFLGAIAAGCAACLVGQYSMVNVPMLASMYWIATFTLKVTLFSVPFVALGMMFSLVTSSAAWARVMALGAVAGSWLGIATIEFVADYYKTPVVADVLTPLFPQGWMAGLFEPGIGWLPSSLALGGLALTFLVLGYLPFSRRDL